MGEDAVDYEAPDEDYDEGSADADACCHPDGYSFVLCVGVLEGVVVEGEVLVEGLYFVEEGEADCEASVA